MGWFLTKSRGRKKRSRGKSSWTWSNAHTLLMLHSAAWLLFLGALAYGWVWAEQGLQRHLADRAAQEPVFVLHALPAWMSGPFEQELRRSLADNVAADPFDHDSLADGAAVVRDNPWVRHLQRVQRRPGGRVEIFAAYRRPVALVQQADGFHLVDAEGVRLPVVYPATLLKKLAMPVVRGVAEPLPHTGSAWEGRDLAAGLRLARLVESQPWGRQVRFVDVSNFAGRRDQARPHLLLQTRTGMVRWGRAPGQERFYEPDVVVKLANLNRVQRKFRSIDAGGQVVDVFGDAVLIHPTAEASVIQGSTIRYTSDR